MSNQKPKWKKQVCTFLSRETVEIIDKYASSMGKTRAETLRELIETHPVLKNIRKLDEICGSAELEAALHTFVRARMAGRDVYMVLMEERWLSSIRRILEKYPDIGESVLKRIAILVSKHVGRYHTGKPGDICRICGRRIEPEHMEAHLDARHSNYVKSNMARVKTHLCIT